MRSTLGLGALLIVTATPFLAGAEDVGTGPQLIPPPELVTRRSPPNACRYEVRDGRIVVSRIDAASASMPSNALDCDDFDRSNASAWVEMVDMHRAFHLALAEGPLKAPQRRAADFLARTARVLACARIRTAVGTFKQAEDALARTRYIAEVAHYPQVAESAAAQLYVVEKIAANHLPDAPLECITKGHAIPIPDQTWREMQGKSWHPSLGCPPRQELALLRIPYFDRSGQPQVGEMITAESVAGDVLEAFAEIYRDGQFRIERMQLIDRFDGDDAKSMTANNTSAFNCRAVTGGGRLSEHAFGTAIDINPIQNPFVTRTAFQPAAGASFSTQAQRRANRDPGLIHEGNAVTRAFARIGWKWGGSWANSKDYQHFSLSGR